MATYTLRQLEYFVAVAETGSVTAAAARVHLSQSAMSTALADLEKALTVQLVVRHHARGVTLTAAGERLLVEARQVLRGADDLQSVAADLGGAVTGTLALGCFAILAPFVLPELLTAADRELPGLTLDTTEESLDHLASGLRSGRLELALSYDLGMGAGVTAESLFTVAPHVVLPRGHRLAGRRRVRLSALADEPMVLLDLPHSRDYFARLFAAAGVRPLVQHRTHSAELARALVARGGCYTILNLRPHGDVSLEGRPYAVVPLDVPLPAEESELRVVLIRLADSQPTRRVEAVAALCRRILPASAAPKQSVE
jgi:DNA-binding transcriptional LysR family regulator